MGLNFLSVDGRYDLGRLPQFTYQFERAYGPNAAFGAAINGTGFNILRGVDAYDLERDTNRDGFFSDLDVVTNPAALSDQRTVYFHRGYSSMTGSAGCQTFPVGQFERFFNALGPVSAQTRFQYVLTNM